MRINSLHLCNFRQHVDTRIDFDAGLTGIIGPNGSGKSTLLEAVAWALYGMPAARGTRESVRSYRAGPRASVKVELDFELSGHRYLVSRGLNNAELYLDGATSPIATSISGVSELLRRRLGMSHDEFFNTYFTGQKELSVMASMTPSDRQHFLSRVLGYERLTAARTLVRDRRSAITSELSGLRAGMPDRDAVNRAVADAGISVTSGRERLAASDTRRTTAAAELDAITPRWESLQREREAAQSLAAEIRVAQSDRSAIERDVARIDVELAELTKAGGEVQSLSADLLPFDGLKEELTSLDRSKSEASRRGTLTDATRELATELEQLRARRTDIETAPALEAETATSLAQARAELESVERDFQTAQVDWARDKQEAETKLKALRDQLKETREQREQIVELGENGICPICARPLESHFRKVLDFLDEQIETITTEGKYYRTREEQLKQTPQELATLGERRKALGATCVDLERRHTRIQSNVRELTSVTRDLSAKEERHAALTLELSTIADTYDAIRHASVRTLVERLTPIAARVASLMARLEREPRVIEEADAAHSRLALADARVGELEARREATPFSEETFTHIRTRFEASATELRGAELAAVKARAELAAAEAALVSATEASDALKKTEQRLAALNAERRLHDELDRAFTDVRSELNQSLRPEISDLASRYIRELTDGRYSEIELDDQYNVIVLEDAIPKPVISGGEEDLANLVLRLSISEMIAERAGQSFSLLILDEVFGSLDENHRHNVVDLLRRLQNQFEQVILITHIESVRDGLDRVITVRYDEATGASRVESESAGRAERPPSLSEELTLDFQEGAAD